jgi:hypothetical protein
VKPGLKRALDFLAYTISGVAVAGGAIYGLQQLPQRPAAVPAAASPVPAAAASSSSAAPEPSPPDAQPAPAGNPDQAIGDANGDTAEHAAFLRDQATFYALQKNCFDAADNNQNGDYPDLQASACNSYTQFAYAKGWDPGPLPAFGQPPQQQAPPADYSANGQADLSAAPQTVIQAPPQVIIVVQNFAGRRAIEEREHHLPAQSGGNSYTQPTRQIGPNYSLPPPQPQPPPQPPIQQQPPPPQVPHPEPHNRMPTTSRPPR